MDEDVMKAIEQVAQQADSDRRVFDIEAFIRNLASDLAGHVQAEMVFQSGFVPGAAKEEIYDWIARNRLRFGNQLAEVTILLLRREFFGNES